jgi:hypothetical protein
MNWGAEVENLAIDLTWQLTTVWLSFLTNAHNQRKLCSSASIEVTKDPLNYSQQNVKHMLVWCYTLKHMKWLWSTCLWYINNFLPFYEAPLSHLKKVFFSFNTDQWRIIELSRVEFWKMYAHGNWADGIDEAVSSSSTNRILLLVPTDNVRVGQVASKYISKALPTVTSTRLWPAFFILSRSSIVGTPPA